MGGVKIVIAGPKGASKSSIASFLSGQADGIKLDTYNPTAGVRILEFDTQVKGFSDAIAVELWDASGDHQYENCWKGIMDGADGVILIYNPDSAGQDQQLSDWFDFFVRKNGLKDEQCMVLAFRTNQPNQERFRPPPLFSRVKAALQTNETVQEIKEMFDDFMKAVTSQNQRSRK
jgi:intraflagellar transport protein 22